jgi:hypothetical protein
MLSPLTKGFSMLKYAILAILVLYVNCDLVNDPTDVKKNNLTFIISSMAGTQIMIESQSQIDTLPTVYIDDCLINTNSAIWSMDVSHNTSTAHKFKIIWQSDTLEDTISTLKPIDSLFVNNHFVENSTTNNVMIPIIDTCHLHWKYAKNNMNYRILIQIDFNIRPYGCTVSDTFLDFTIGTTKTFYTISIYPELNNVSEKGVPNISSKYMHAYYYYEGPGYHSTLKTK